MRSPLAWLLAAALPADAFLDKRAAINDCLADANVPQDDIGSSNFTQDIEPYNLRVPFTPVAVAVPTTVPQVQAAVKCAANLSVPISAKSGGHSYASSGIGGEDGHLMISMKWFKNVTVDVNTSIATIQPGSRLGNVAQALYNQGKRAISHGTCPGVGAGGLALHGGYGFISHTKGLALDFVKSTDVVLANGTLVTASQTSNPDLFWALRGAGSSYGIVTSFQFETFEAPDSNIVFSYSVSLNQSTFRSAFAALQDFANSTDYPNEMNLRLFCNRYSNTLSGVFYGTLADFNAAIAPIKSKLNITSAGTVRTGLTWLNTLLANANGVLTTDMSYDAHETFFSKSLMTVSVGDDAMDAFAKYWYNTARSNTRDWYWLVDLHGGPHSSVSAVDVDATSYAHRKALLKMEFYDRVWTDEYPEDGFNFLNGWVASITENSTPDQWGMYINYADTTLSVEEAHEAYWGDHYERLLSIKESVDPGGLVTFPQAVGRT